MTYHCGIDGDLSLRPCEPHIVCDGCGATCAVATRRTHGPAKWFLNGRCPPKWSGGQRMGYMREDWCPACTAVRASRVLLAQEVADRINRGDLAGLGLSGKNIDTVTARVNADGLIEVDIAPAMFYGDGRRGP